MEDQDKLVRVFSGTEQTVSLLKNELEQLGIFGIVQNEFQSGIIAGFYGGGPTAVDLFIPEKKVNQAEQIVRDFLGRM